MRARLYMVTAATLALLACEPDDGGGDGEAVVVDAMRRALPQAEEMSLRVPASSALTPEQATFYGFTRGVTLHVNGFVRVIANAVADITELPPTKTDGDTFAIWGPHTAPLSPATWRVRVDRAAPGRFTYRVEAWPKASDEGAAQVVLEGEHVETEAKETGTWVYDMTAAHSLEPIAHESTGRVEVAYVLADARSLEVHFDKVQSRSDPNVTSTLYRYTEAASRDGTLDYIANLDIHADDDPSKDRRELLQVRSRWVGEGAGRVDLLATHGDLPVGVAADMVECWDGAFARSYVHLAYAGFEQTDGDPAACPYEDVQRPEFDGFDADAFADADLVAALPTPAVLDVQPAAVADPVEEPATYYTAGRAIVTGLARPVEAVLALLGQITRNPPTDCEPMRCVWGPYTDWQKGTSFQLTIDRALDEGYTYEVLTWRFGDAVDAGRKWVRGGYVQGASGDEGRGWMELDFDVLADLDPGETTRGLLRAEFARMDDRRQLATRVEGLVSETDAEPADGRYFLDTGDDGGLLELRFPIDVGDGGQRETAEGTIRWRPDGSGVANMQASEGDLGVRETLGVECWDDRAARTHLRWLQQSAGGQDRPAIDAAACVFDDWLDPVLEPLADER